MVKTLIGFSVNISIYNKIQIHIAYSLSYVYNIIYHVGYPNLKDNTSAINAIWGDHGDNDEENPSAFVCVMVVMFYTNKTTKWNEPWKKQFAFGLELCMKYRETQSLCKKLECRYGKGQVVNSANWKFP